MTVVLWPLRERSTCKLLRDCAEVACGLTNVQIENNRKIPLDLFLNMKSSQNPLGPGGFKWERILFPGCCIPTVTM